MKECMLALTSIGTEEHVANKNKMLKKFEKPFEIKGQTYLYHQKETGDAFCVCKPLMLNIHTQCELLKSS
jgi:hypothetical protein